MEHAEDGEEQYTEEYHEGMEDIESDEDDEDGNYDEDVHDDDEFDEDHDEQHDEPEEAPRPLGRFMTPQLPRTMSVREARMSLGGHGADTGPRRVRVVAPWKVSEIEVPNAVKEEESSVPSSSSLAPPSTPRSPTKREKLSEEEREVRSVCLRYSPSLMLPCEQAIRARRRSALATPDNFFKGQTPGSRRTLFPSLAPLPSPSFAQPNEPTAAASEPGSTAVTASMSSVKAEDDEKEDTAVLLARMQQMVDGMKQRQSLGRQSLNVSPRKREGGFSLLAPGHATAHAPSRILIEEDEHEDDEDDAITQGASNGAPAPAQQTPIMADLRHVFGRAHAQTSSPALTGMRDMFRVQPLGPTETPRMEGVKEMLSTPRVQRPASPERRSAREEPPAEAPQPDVPEEADEPIEPLPARGTRGRKAPGTSRIARRTPAAAAQSAPAKSTRASSQVPEESATTEDAGAETGRAVRRTRARTADGEVEQVCMQQSRHESRITDVGPQIPRATRGKAAEKKPATPEPQEDEEDRDQPPATAARASRRTRQTTDSSTSSHTSHPDDTADVKPARKTRAKTPTTTTKAGPARRGTRAKPIEVPEEDNDDDPLDSLPRAGTPAEEEPPAPAAARVRRGTRSKIPVGAVKQEDVEPSLPSSSKADEGHDAGPATGARATRARRTPVPRHPTPSTTGTAGRSGTRTRGAAAAATPAPGGEAAIPEDKENTPEAGEEDEESKAPAARVRAGGKGARKAATPSVKEVEEEVQPVPKTRATRARAGRA